MSGQRRRRRGGGLNIYDVSVTDAQTQGPNTTTHTYSAADLGAADANRAIVVAIVGVQSGSRSVSSATIAGISTDVDVNRSSLACAAIIKAKVPSGTTGDIVITFTGAVARSWIVVHRVLANGDLEIIDTASATHSSGVVNLDMDVNADNFIVGAVGTRSGSTHTWSGITEYSDNASGIDRSSFAHDYPGGTGSPATIRCTNATTSPGTMDGVAVAYG